MAEQLSIETLGSLLREIERRLKALETAPRAGYTAVRNGSLRVIGPASGSLYPNVDIGSNGTDVAMHLAKNSTETTIFPFEVLSVGGVGGVVEVNMGNPDRSANVFAYEDDLGMIFPSTISTWQRSLNQSIDASGNVTTTSAAYVQLWNTAICAVNNGFTSLMTFLVPGGTTADIKVTAQLQQNNNLLGAAAGGEQTVWQSLGVVATTGFSRSDAIPTSVFSPASNPIGSIYTLRAYARRTAGAGTIGIQIDQPSVSIPV